jgi:hypothetical protein
MNVIGVCVFVCVCVHVRVGCKRMTAIGVCVCTRAHVSKSPLTTARGVVCVCMCVMHAYVCHHMCMCALQMQFTVSSYTTFLTCTITCASY